MAGFLLSDIWCSMNLNRNVRNNNPLNIRVTNDKWEGAIGDDGEFVIFESPEYGFRAAYKILIRYISFHGIKTVSKIINRWAPSCENHTDNYIKYINQKMPHIKGQNVKVEWVPKLMLHMSDFEGAKGHFSIEQAKAGVALAKNRKVR